MDGVLGPKGATQKGPGSNLIAIEPTLGSIAIKFEPGPFCHCHKLVGTKNQLHRYPLLADNSPMVFIDLPIFSRCASALFSDEDLTEMQNTLLENPAAGDLIPGGKGLRKLRVPLPRSLSDLKKSAANSPGRFIFCRFLGQYE